MIIYEDDVEEFLEHHGVKGMRWGSRKASGSTSKRQSRRQRREGARQERIKIGQKKANDLLVTALKDPTTLINLNGRLIVTGKEFTDYMSRGGILDVNATRVYAQRKNKRGPYVLQ